MRVRIYRSMRHRARSINCRFRGISAIEVLVVLSTVGVLATLGIMLIVPTRESARRQQCQWNLSQLGLALHAYHDAHGALPPAAVWSTTETESLALHLSKRHDRFTRANWAQMLLPYLGEEELARQFDPNRPIAAPENEGARTRSLSWMTCPSDTYNRPDNPHIYEPASGRSISFARGNYAINGGTQCYKTEPPTTSGLSGDPPHLVMDRDTRDFRLSGNGIAGFNVSFSLDEFTNGTSTLVAFEEVRAGIHPVDPRGAWALGQIASSVTWGHGVNSDDYGPNNQWPRSDDILGCGRLHELLGKERLLEERMPCVWYVDQNQNATARSQHPGGVNVLFLDGAVRFISDRIDPGLWHVVHSRETPLEMLADGFEEQLTILNEVREADGPDRTGLIVPATEPLSVIENSIGMKFVLLPQGEFVMGLPDAGNDHDLPEQVPPHRVRITRPFYLGRHEVTEAHYDRLMDGNASYHQSETTEGAETDRFPVEQVSWFDASEFCNRLSSLPAEQEAGRRYRLPTEAEWEYACRAGSTEPYQWTRDRRENDDSGEAAGIRPALPLTPVGSYAPNAFGLCDMRGNVWEWCADWFDRDYYTHSPLEDPQGPARGYLKVVRGGDWRFVGEYCKIDYPVLPPWKGSRVVGFRVVCELAKP